MSKFKSGPKVLLFDIETAPILGYVWGLWENNLGLSQVKQDWHILSWSAKWLDDPASKVMYQDQRNSKKVENDKLLLREIWKLLDEADVVITQNGVKFDSRKLNARFAINKMPPPSPYKHIDTLKIAKKHFGFTSNSLEYMSDKLCTKYKKLKHKKFPGFDLWKECLNGNKEAWDEMARYNKHDVLALEELYHVLAKWDNGINFDLYRDKEEMTCNCGSKTFQNRGYAFTTTGKFQRLMCTKCGAWTRGSVNLLSKDKRDSLKRRIT